MCRNRAAFINFTAFGYYIVARLVREVVKPGTMEMETEMETEMEMKVETEFHSSLSPAVP